MDLKNIKNTIIFYNDRYTKGYMEDWPIEKKQRIIKIIKNLNLPDYGEALDFGCGNGVFTEVIKEALPQWCVYGCDISNKAIQNASKRFKKCIFFVSNNKKYIDKKFDFIFSHHVLEHVFNIKDVANQINERSKKNASMLHIFPCGNDGSFEYKICKLRIDGVNTEMENRFFFEDEGHVRRMTTIQCFELFNKYNFSLLKDFYSNQYFGAVDWITKSPPLFILNMFNPAKGKNLKSKIKLTGMLIIFFLIHIFRKPSILFKRISQIHNKSGKHFLFLVFFWVPSKLTIYFDDYIKFLSTNEWNKLKNKKNGSEMYLYFTRNITV